LTLLEILHQVSARLAWIREEYDSLVREQALADLEADVAGWLAQYEERWAA
jgi:hypothetical protein